jgi:hypothetical protein
MKGKGGNGRSSMLLMGRGTMVLVVSMVMMFAVISAIAQDEAEVTVTVNAPEYVEEGETFDVTIEVDTITDFNTGLFDLSFDHKVVEVEDVTDGSIDDIAIPIDMWDNMDMGTIRVLFTVPEATSVNGSGCLAKISFSVKGDEGDECALDIENGFLGNTTAEEIVANWIDATIKIGEEEGEEEEQPPSITAGEPAEETVSSTDGESITFEITVDQEVDISWQINGTEVHVDEGVTKAAYTNTSAVAGTWNVSARATNTESGLSRMHTWIWSVTSTATEASEGAPTPTLAPGVTPSPTPKAASSPAVTSTPTVKPASTPKSEEPTPTPKTPGLEAICAIAAMSAIAYALRRR